MPELTLWRLVKRKHAATAFSGEGAAWFGGRWIRTACRSFT
jgi:RES domain-containing protein